MKKHLLTVLALVASLHASTQGYLHQVYVLNEGYFNWQTQEQQVPVSLGSFDPFTQEYQTLGIIEGSRFASDLLVDDQHVYVAADAKLLKYSKEDHSLVAQADVEGIRKIARWNDRILITRGELGGLSHYFEVRDAADLQLIDAITPAEGLPYSIEDVIVIGDQAWLAVNNAFDQQNITGLVSVIDLPAMEVETSIDLGPNGLNPEKLMVAGGSVYVLNNTDLSQSTISEIDIDAAALQQTIGVANNSGCGASALAAQQEKVYFMEYAVNTLARYDITTNTVTDTIENGISAYGLVDDPINARMYVTTTDFFSSGELHVMQYDGTITATISVGVSPGHLELDIRSITAVPEKGTASLLVSPNPAADRVRVQGIAGDTRTYRLIDATGRVVEAGSGSIINGSAWIDVSHLEQGAYTLQFEDRSARFVKH